MEEKDYKEILNAKGYSVGYNGVGKLNLIEEEIIKKFKDELKNAKCIYISLTINKEQSLFSIAEVLNKISNRLNNNVKTVFHTDTSDDIFIKQCHYKILIAGLTEINYKNLLDN